MPHDEQDATLADHAAQVGTGAAPAAPACCRSCRNQRSEHRRDQTTSHVTQRSCEANGPLVLAGVSIATLDVEAVRRRYSALQRDLVLLDGPGGTQVPDEVIDAISAYLRESNANMGGPFETSERTVRVVDAAREAAGRFLGCSPDEVTFGANMTSLSFALSRTAGRGFEPGDEIVVTRLDHDGNVAPWLELAARPRPRGPLRRHHRRM